MPVSYDAVIKPPNFPPQQENSREKMMKCPVCQKELVVYDKAANKYICLNNKECNFMNDTLQPSTIQPVAPQPVNHYGMIKKLDDLKGKIIKNFTIVEENELEKLILELEGCDKQIHIIPYINVRDYLFLEAKLIGKKQIITYEDIEEELT